MHGRDAPGAVMMEKDLEEGDGVGDILEEWVDGQRGAEVGPEGPMQAGGAGVRSGNAEADGVVSSAEISHERSSGGGLCINRATVVVRECQVSRYVGDKASKIE